MKKPLKILAILLGGLLVLLAILAITLTLVFDPNEYKGEIIEVVKDKTGRELRIEGKLGWSFFPWIGIETGRLELGNAPGFGAEPMARIDAAGAKVELLPLLRKQVVVDTVFLDGLKLNLARNTAGKTNWDDLTAPPSKVEKASEKATPGKAPGIGGISVNKIDIRKADIAWKDQKNAAQYSVHNLDFNTGVIAAGKPVDIHLSFDLESGQPPLRTRVDLKSRMNLDLETQALDVDNLTLVLGDLTLQTSFKGTHILDAPTVNGALEISPFNPRALMDKLGVKVETVNKTALTKLSLKTKFSATTESVEMKDLAINLDDSRLNGSLAVRHFTKPAYQFDLTLDRIDLDSYLPPATPATAAGSKPGTATPAQPVEVPLSALRALAVQGKFRILQFKAMNLHSSDALIQITADNGLITLGPNQAKLYSGKYAGRTTLDVRGKTPALVIDESVSGVELAPMLKDAMQFDKFTGTANLSAKVTAQGLDASQIKQTLNGTARFAVLSGAIKGVDLSKMIGTIKTAERDNLQQKLTELKPLAIDETRFSELNGTAQISNGVVQNNDLKIKSPNLIDITGKGSADLPRETLNYTITTGKYGVIIDGPFAQLKYKPDLSAIVKGKVEEKKSEIKEKLQEKLKDRFKLR